MTLANLTNEQAFGSIQAGEQQQKRAALAPNPLYMTLTNVKDDVFDR